MQWLQHERILAETTRVDRQTDSHAEQLNLALPAILDDRGLAPVHLPFFARAEQDRLSLAIRGSFNVRGLMAGWNKI